MLFTTITFAQDNVTLNISQDARLLFVGDNKGNKAPTMDLSIRSEWQGKQFNGYYFFIAPEFEYAQLAEDYYRYSANIGWTFNQWIENFSFTASVGYGVIKHDFGTTSFGNNFQISYKANKIIEFFIDLETNERRDLLIYESTDIIFGTAFKTSGKIGVKFYLR